METTDGNFDPPANRIPSYDSVYHDTYSNNKVNVNLTSGIVIVVLVGLCFTLEFVSATIRKCYRDDVMEAPTTAQLARSVRPKPRGLNKAEVDSLPLVHCKDLDVRDNQECPICLICFEPENTLRVLPTCKHIFHQACIDLWFELHSTCPSCRASLLDHFGIEVKTNGEQVVARDQVETTSEVLETGDRNVEVHRMINMLGLEDLTATGVLETDAVVSLENERGRAHGTPLSRNPPSFVCTALGVKPNEKGASSSTEHFSRSYTFQAQPSTPLPSIHRSNSLGIDMLYLRNLLTEADCTLNQLQSDESSTSWLRRARSMDSGVKCFILRDGRSGEATGNERVVIDLESGITSAAMPGSNEGQSS